MTPSLKGVAALLVGAAMGGTVGATVPLTHRHGWCYSYTGDFYLRCFSADPGPGDWAVHRLCDARLEDREQDLDDARWRYVDASVASSILRSGRR